MVSFRNITVKDSDPVDQWGVEGLLTAIDRGGLPQWRRIIRAIKTNPHGKLADEVEQAVQAAEDSGAASLISSALDCARLDEKQRFGQKFRALLSEAELSQSQAATLLGTSRTRVNSYCSGAVTPSAIVLDRLQMKIQSRRSQLI